ncbi:MAG: penicillin-binding protein 2 [Kiritimatiellaeota bacterium]|nr:penicillin-binding protein 2 [Kiritimatiellota bacterium]
MQRDIYMVRVLCVFVATTAAFSLLLAHFYELQVVRHNELFSKAKRTYTSRRRVPGQRGLILDRNGYLLAGNRACRDVLAEPRAFVADLPGTVSILSRELGVSRVDLLRRFRRALTAGKIEVPVKYGVDLERVERLRAYRLHGLRFVDSYRRTYPKGRMLAALLGFVNAGGVGVAGIEKEFDSRLRPSAGEVVYERDRRGRPLRMNALRRRRARDGANLFLTIEEPIQHIVESELDALMEEFQPKAAFAVMANPRTGEIMAMAQKPGFDPNRIAPEDLPYVQNRLLLTGFEPGSVMKAMAVAGALDFGVVTLDTVFDCEDGCWYYLGRPLRDSGHRYGKLTVREIIQKSSNIGAAKIALRMGPVRLYQVLRRFGFGRPTGIGLSGEAPGIFRPLAKWDGLSITRFPIGQGILVTPLQLVQAYAALANDGVIMRLHVVQRLEDPNTGLRETFKPEAVGRAVRPAAVHAIVQALKLVTRDGGTAPKAAVEGFEVAGKTGTAQKVVDGTYSHSRYVASFIGFVPAADPAFVLLVMVDEPRRGGHYGGTVAAPAFSRIAERTLRYLDIAPERPELTGLQSPQAAAMPFAPDGTTFSKLP